MSLIKILVYKKNHTTKDGKRKFTTYRTEMYLPFKNEENKGAQHCYLDLKFGKEIKPERLSEFKMRGYITCKSEDVSAPFVYKVEEEVKDGVAKKKYPCVWIHGFEKYEEAVRRQTQNAFVTDEPETESIEVDPSDE